MRHQRRDGLLALVFVALLALGTLASLPNIKGANPTPIIWGVVRDNKTFQPLPANVTLVEAHGGFSLGPFKAGGDGFFSFSPTGGRYYLSLDNGGYFSNVTDSSFITFDGSADVVRNATLDPYGGTSSKLTVTTELNSKVTVIHRTRNQIVASKPVNATGVAIFNLWNDAFWLMVNKTGRETNVTPISVAGPTNPTVLLSNSVPVVGTVLGDGGRPITTGGIVAYLFDKDVTKPIWKRLIAANLQGSSGFSFDAYGTTITPANFVIIVDADGYAGKVNSITVRGPTNLPNQFVALTRSPYTPASTEIVFASNWSAFKLYRNVTLAPDGVVEGLPYGFLHGAELQVALAFGNMSGIAGGAERAKLTARLMRANANNMTTDGLLTFNGKTYYAANDFSATVSTYPSPLWYRTSVTYYILPRGSTLPQAQKQYYLNVTGRQLNTFTSTNYTYNLTINRGYERTSAIVVQGSAIVLDFIKIKVYPTAPAAPTSPTYARVNILIQTAASGIAYWKVIGPTDRFYELNSDPVNYQVIVAQGVAMQLSAADSTYPNAPDNRAFPDFNYTWQIGTSPNRLYGQKPISYFNTTGFVWLNLTLRYPNGNTSSRNRVLTVDGMPPSGGRISVTFNGVETTTVDERARVRFTPLGWTDNTGIRGYDWGFGDGTPSASSTPISSYVEHIYAKPGSYTVSLQVTDYAGNKLSTPSMVTVTVRDITRPVVGFVVNDTRTQNIDTLTEGVLYTFDASKGTSDNYDILANLTFGWNFADGTPIQSGPKVTHTYASYGTYNMSLVVTDRAGNKGYLNKTYQVAPDFTIRPALVVKGLRIDPKTPQESTFFGASPVRISLNVTNSGGASAGNITISLVAFRKGDSPGSPTTISNAQWFNVSGASTNAFLRPGETKRVVFTWSAGAAGNWTIKVTVSDTRQPPQKLADSTSQTQVEVFQAGWKTPALYGGIAAVVVGIPALLFVRRRMKARAEEGGEEEAASGRLTRRRRAERRKQKEEEEKEEK